MSQHAGSAGAPSQSAAEVIEILGHVLSDLRFGSVELKVSEGKAIEIDVTRKVRFNG